MPIKKAPQIAAWSYSRLVKWEECPFSAKCKFIDKIPEPQSPALARGSSVDEAINKYLGNPRAKLPEAGKLFAKELAALRKRTPWVQRELAFRKDWSPCGWFDADCWLRVKWDYGYLLGNAITVIDGKTGKIREEQKPQLKLYGLSGLLMHPETSEAVTAYWYYDQGEIVDGRVAREEVEEQKRYWEGRAAPMLLDRTFTATPSYKCKWCPYRKDAGGPCKFSGGAMTGRF